jgi:hypothetical protein
MHMSTQSHTSNVLTASTTYRNNCDEGSPAAAGDVGGDACLGPGGPDKHFDAAGPSGLFKLPHGEGGRMSTSP